MLIRPRAGLALLALIIHLRDSCRVIHQILLVMWMRMLLLLAIVIIMHIVEEHTANMALHNALRVRSIAQPGANPWRAADNDGEAAE